MPIVADLVEFNPRRIALKSRIVLSLLAGFTAAISFALLGYQVSTDSRSDAAIYADSTARNILEVIRRDIGRTFESYDLSVQGVITALEAQDFSKVGPDGQHLMMFDRSAQASDYSSILVSDADGNVRYDSESVVARRVNLSDRDFFQVHRDDPNIGLYISKPFRSRNGAYMAIALSRRLNKPDGSFAGIVSGSLRLDYFTGLFANLDVGPNGTITLFKSDGTLIMRSPFRMSLIGKEVPNSATLTVNADPTANPDRESSIDGSVRRFTTTRIGNYPLVLSVGQSLGDIYGRWWERMKSMLMMCALMIGALFILCFGLLSEFGRRRKSEADLKDVATELQRLARTDGLTGLANRRAFDEALEREWQHHMEFGAPVSCLLIDIDYFKKLNDVRGHLAGDEALQIVGRTLLDEISTQAALAARYGGEEFIVLLPGVAHDRAFFVAENIRHRIGDLHIPNPSSPSAYLSVSIGVASTDQFSYRGAGELLHDADIALYSAKQSGRNNSQTCPQDQRKPHIDAVLSEAA